MADRRMLTKKITESDAFLDLPLSSQALYMHLMMSADDDGFVNNPKKIQRMCGASEDDFRLLLLKSFVISFDSGVIVIKHWRMHNYIQNDRYKQTDYRDELAMLKIKENKSYSLTEGECIQNVSKLDTQVRLDKVNKEKDISKDISKEKVERFVPPTVDEVRKYCLERNNNVDPDAFVDFYESKGWMVGKNKMKSWKAAVRTWERTGDNKKPDKKKNAFGEFPQRQYGEDALREMLKQKGRQTDE